MEKRIKLLPESVQHMISAGEVVEGPSSVIKELVENSVDADARHVDVDVVESGFSKITVRDDGSGMYKEDLPLAVAEHATSKIETFNDISRVSSFGFRGEALSSIGSVSELTILSRRNDESVGGRLEIKNGKPSVSDFAGPSGTTVIVENLFYNVPARKKFMKSASAESRFIRETVVRAALSAPEVAFSCTVNGKKSFSVDAASSRGERISQLFGDDELSGLNEDSISDISVRIHGFVSRPHFMKASRSEQYLFVNNRPVEMKHYSFLLSRAYDSAAPQGKYPAAFVYVDIKPELVDVNIHPAKREIKFFDQRYVEGLIVSMIKKTLDRAGQRFDLFESSEPAEKTIPDDAASSAAGEPTASYESVPAPQTEILREDYPERPLSSASNSESSREFKMGDLQHYLSFGGRETGSVPHEFDNSVIGMLFGTYILSESEDELRILDFHAAHERINYDRLLSSAGEIESQTLVFPEIVKIPRHRFDAAEELVPELNRKGFDIEPFSDDSFIVRAVPPLLGDASVKEFVSGLFDSFDGIRDGENAVEERERLVAERIACHASRRRNDHMSREEMSALLARVMSGEHALTCPHGRPYLYTVKRAEFEKMFRR
jgi:DNA mismatch repair protein MutL